jgi:hypothetical protein
MQIGDIWALNQLQGFKFLPVDKIILLIFLIVLNIQSTAQLFI